MAKAKTYYKILQDGRSFNGGKLTWSLPVRNTPGEWHEVEGPLVRCRNGLHLTNEPTYHRQSKTICYLAEVEGETIGPFEDELVARRCRLVRRVPWDLFKSAETPDPEPVADSPALVLLRHVWDHQGEGMGKSWARLNDAMQKALKLAIVCGMKFGPDDFATFKADFNSGYWIGDGEHFYSAACALDRSHGENRSAQQAYEKWRGRKPFIIRESVDGPLVRLCVGRRFNWHEALERRIAVVITSFADDQGHVVACSYKDSDRSKIDRRFKITHEQIKEYHAFIKAKAGEKQSA